MPKALTRVFSLSSLCVLLVTLNLAFAPTARAGLFDDDEARKAILDLRAKFDAFQRDVNERLNIVNGRLDRLDQNARGQLTLANEIEQVRSEMAKLRGQLEVQANELSELQRKNKDQAAQLNERLRRFDPVAVTIDGKTAQVDPNEKRSYDGAIALFQAGDFKAAQLALSAFSVQFPQSAYRTNAEYWSATSVYAQRDWRAAIVALQSFVAKFSDSPKVAEALLSLGGAHLESKDNLNARKTFEQLIERFADTPAAVQAKERLASLPAERGKR